MQQTKFVVCLSPICYAYCSNWGKERGNIILKKGGNGAVYYYFTQFVLTNET